MKPKGRAYQHGSSHGAERQANMPFALDPQPTEPQDAFGRAGVPRVKEKKNCMLTPSVLPAPHN